MSCKVGSTISNFVTTVSDSTNVLAEFADLPLRPTAPQIIAHDAHSLPTPILQQAVITF
jgi:hypothetical protein